MRYLTSFTSSQQESVVTEHVIPLDVAVEKQEKEEIYAGLCNILEAILFLHEKVRIRMINIFLRPAALESCSIPTDFSKNKGRRK